MIEIFVKSLRARWLEYALAAVVVAIAAAALTVQRSLAVYQEQQVHELAHRLGRNMLVVPAETDLSQFYQFVYGQASMPAAYADTIQRSEAAPHISLIEARLYGNVNINGVPAVLIGEQTMRRGAASTPTSPASSGKVLLGPSVAHQLSVQEGDRLQLEGHELVVDGVLERAPDGLDQGLFTSLETAQGLLNRPSSINAMRFAGCWCRVDVSVLGSQVEQALPGTKALTQQAMLRAQQGAMATAARYAVLTKMVALLLIAGMVLILLTSQVRRTKREIGLLLAVGAPPLGVAMYVFVAAGLIGVLGAVAGHLAGALVTATTASHFMGAALTVPEGSLPGLLGFVVSVSLLAAVIPAWRAVHLDVTAILREV